jgi:hypothetical protein
MDRCYSAFGLALRSSFQLPGMTAGEAEEGSLPLDLNLVAPAALEEAWSGPRSASPWRGKLGDGEELAIAWGEAGDLLFDYSGGAKFLFEPGRRRLACAPLDPAALAWQRVLLSRVLPDLALAYGCEALHAAAVEMPFGVLAIAASSGTGKSSLVAELMRRGALLFADDVLVLGRRDGKVVAHPGSPHANLAAESAPERLGEVLAGFGAERWIGTRKASRKVNRVAVIALLEREGGLPLAASPLAASPLALAPHMLGLPDDEPGREASRFALYSDLVESAALLRLSGGDGDDPAALADVLERELTTLLPATSGAAA